jgi:hypothetical protein
MCRFEIIDAFVRRRPIVPEGDRMFAPAKTAHVFWLLHMLEQQIEQHSALWFT